MIININLNRLFSLVHFSDIEKQELKNRFLVTLEFDWLNQALSHQRMTHIEELYLLHKSNIFKK